MVVFDKSQFECATSKTHGDSNEPGCTINTGHAVKWRQLSCGHLILKLNVIMCVLCAYL